MGIEYTSKIVDGSPLNMQRLVGELQRTLHYEVEGDPTANALCLRFAGHERRPLWPEDICVTIDQGVVGVLIHSGTREQRNRFIQDLSSAMDMQGIHIQLIEN